MSMNLNDERDRCIECGCRARKPNVADLLIGTQYSNDLKQSQINLSSEQVESAKELWNAIDSCLKNINCIRMEKTWAEEDIEKLIQPYGLSLSRLPITKDTHYAYIREDHDKAIEMTEKWERFGVFENISVLCDFICHQSDVINLLCKALEKSKNDRDVL